MADAAGLSGAGPAVAWNVGVKTCFKCLSEKPRTDFYAHPHMADGHLNKCKSCTKLDMRIDRVSRPRVREYDRQRAGQPQRVALRTRITKEWRAANPAGYKAHSAANRAVREGTLTAPALCEGCGLPKRLEKHHHDYSKPLLVVWLCKPCHAIADKLRRKLEAS
jgi:hypothetical protein